MVESGAKEVSEDDMLGALLFGFEAIKELVAFKKKSLQQSVNQNGSDFASSRC